MLEIVPDIAQSTHGIRNIFADIRNVPTRPHTVLGMFLLAFSVTIWRAVLCSSSSTSPMEQSGESDSPWPQSEDRPITLFVISMYVSSMSFSQRRHSMNVCLFLFMYVICIYIRTKELKCYLVQMMLTSHDRKIDLGQQTNDCSQWPEKVSRCPLIV